MTVIITTTILTTRSVTRTTLGILTVGLELRVKNRISIIGFLETLPALETTDNIGNFIDFGIRFQSFGVEVAFCF